MPAINLLQALQISLLRKSLEYLTAPSLAKLLIAANDHEVRVNVQSSLKNLELVGDRSVDAEYSLPVVVRVSGIMIRWMMLHGLRANRVHFVAEDNPQNLPKPRSYSDDAMLRSYVEYCPTLRAFFADQGTRLQLYEAIANLKNLQYVSTFYAEGAVTAATFLRNCQQLKYARVSGPGFIFPVSNGCQNLNMEYLHIFDSPSISVPDFAVVFPNLIYLLITRVCSVTDETIPLLRSRLPRLSYLSIEDCPNISCESVTELREIVGPNVRVGFRSWRVTAAVYEMEVFYSQLFGDEKDSDY